jgi:hypothetical protein
LKRYLILVGFALNLNLVAIQALDSENVYGVDSIRPKSLLFENTKVGDHPTDTQSLADLSVSKNDTLELPEKTVRAAESDSFSKEFKKYWAKVEKRDGFDKLRSQIQRHNDPDNSWVPHFYLFDSNLIVFPLWFIWRNKHR